MRVVLLPHRILVAICIVLAVAEFMLCPQVADAQTSVTMDDIMTNLPNSPYLGKSVSISGIVIGVMNTGGFYVVEPDSKWDGIVSTAEGIPVFYASAADNPSCAVVGNAVTVVGTVTNSAAVTAADTPGTGITPSSCTVTGTGTVTKTIPVTYVFTTFGDAQQFTGMPVSNTSFYAIGPTGGTLDEVSETVTSSGQFWATLTSNSSTNNHLFRSAGIAGDEYVPSTAPSGVVTWGGNPQRILIDTVTLGGTAVDITVGQTITCAVGSNITLGASSGIGLVDYTLGYARLLIFKSSVCTVGGTVAATTSSAADSTHFKVGTLDLNRFYGTTVSSGATTVSATAFARRVAKATTAITNAFGSPDIMSLQEIQNQATLTSLADSINTAGGSYTPCYGGDNNDSASLNLGFLVKNTVTNSTCTLAQASATYTTNGGAATLWERPPLVMTGDFIRTGKNYSFVVIDVHLTIRDNIGDATLGPDIRAHRAAQAAALSTLVQSYQTAGKDVIVAGNFNAYEYNDGYVDVLGVVNGSPAASGTVTLYQASNTTAALTDFTTSIVALQRYNIIERGNAASLEHILASATITDSTSSAASLASYMTSVTQPHFSTDFASINTNDATTAAGLTPHDGQVVAFLIPPVPTTASISSSSLNFGDVDLGSSSSKALTVTNTTSFTSTVTISKVAISGTNSSDFSQSSSCTSLSEGSTCTVTVNFTPTATGTRTATLTVTNDSTSNPTLTTTLTGTGVATAATLMPATQDFGTVVIGSTSSTKSFTFTNTSSSDTLTVSSVTVTGDYSVISNGCGATIPAAGSCVITVVFTPTTSGTRTGTLTVLNSSSSNPTLTAALTGIGVSAIAVSSSSLNFGNVDLGQSSAAQTVTITNSTSSAVKVSSLVISGDYAYTTTCGSTIASLGSCKATIVFTPTATGTRTGTLNVTTAAGSVTVALTGDGVDFTIAFTPTSGTVIAGVEVTPSIVVTPLGGFAGVVSLTCTTDAAGSKCTPASSSFTASSTITKTVTITTTSKYTVIGYGGLGVRGWLLALISLALGSILRRARQGARRLVWITLASMLPLATSGVMSGCGGKYPDLNDPYTAPGTYTYTMTATDGTLTRAATFSLVVKAK